jgi:hypothetical protein
MENKTKILELLLELSLLSDDIKSINQFKLDNSWKFEKIKKLEESLIRSLKTLIKEKNN